MQPFTEKTINIMKNIPSGRVASYGQIAKMAGNQRAARQVARILHSMSSKYEIPWHRIVNAKGEIVIGNAETATKQRFLLEQEGVIVKKNRVCLKTYRWLPEEFDWEWMEG